ncbi:DUF4176 domain-containing protein [Paenilisteria rocourtiae]|uniref:DUF4176 domain-containing protein n=1 Tax=Listeria rocourtiae TaxID=647910 RepID=A0A4R6ZQB2_9LIST|nr:DUF4176 domain-containing protein [Listeria rocourtiae]EUJ43741.1 hypothetical protein PROCOU_15199 [Listeria rocourtiae FSL F6-920]MBC1604162.1 DUF4176 domain-containing protein [Listeria rocourtiae]TDR54665.1 hypothetical protein DFP96_102259 [Listeria rocourtiae]
MEELLPLGSVVKLKNGDKLVLVTSRLPLYNNSGVIGYFEYGACLYPDGHTNQLAYFFNGEDIQDIYFKGYINEDELKFQETVREQSKDIPYPRLELIVEQSK